MMEGEPNNSFTEIPTDAMWRSKKLRAGITVAVLGLGLVGIVLTSSVCSCLPDVYEEMDLAAVPAHVMEKAHSLAPGLIFQRAWKFAPGGRFETDVELTGYILRGRVNWYQSRDIEVRLGDFRPGPEYLEPIK
jgi:hypothetical protein